MCFLADSIFDNTSSRLGHKLELTDNQRMMRYLRKKKKLVCNMYNSIRNALKK